MSWGYTYGRAWEGKERLRIDAPYGSLWPHPRVAALTDIGVAVW